MLKLKKQKAEETDSFPAFYQNYERLIRGTLFHLVGTNDLDDLVQQTFIRCWESYTQFKGESKTSTWIIRIAINLAHDHWRKNKNHLKAVAPEKAQAVVDEKDLATSIRQENRQALDTALKELSAEQRTVVVLMYFQELSLEEISEVTQDAVGTIKSRLHYAKAELKRLLEKMGIEV